MRELIRMTADLGAKNLRVFLAWWGITRHPKLASYDIAEGLLADRPREVFRGRNLGLVPRELDRVCRVTPGRWA